MGVWLPYPCLPTPFPILRLTEPKRQVPCQADKRSHSVLHLLLHVIHESDNRGPEVFEEILFPQSVPWVGHLFDTSLSISGGVYKREGGKGVQNSCCAWLQNIPPLPSKKGPCCHKRGEGGGEYSQVPKKVVSKKAVLADVPLYRHFNFLTFCFFYVLAVRRCLFHQRGQTQTKCSPWIEVWCALRISSGWVWSQSRVPGGGGGSEGVDNAPRAESSRHDGTIFVPSGGTAVPREVRRYHPCTLRRYDGTTSVPSGGMTVPPLYLEVVRLWNSCHFLYWNHTWEDDRCTLCRYKGGSVVPRAGTRVVPSYLLEVHYPFCFTQYICFAILSNDLGRQAAVQLQVQSGRHSE